MKSNKTVWAVLQDVGGEYEVYHYVTAKEVEQIDRETVKADGVLISFGGDVLKIEKHH